jgi:hypothetical protein
VLVGADIPRRHEGSHARPLADDQSIRGSIDNHSRLEFLIWVGESFGAAGWFDAE